MQKVKRSIRFEQLSLDPRNWLRFSPLSPYTKQQRVPCDRIAVRVGLAVMARHRRDKAVP